MGGGRELSLTPGPPTAGDCGVLRKDPNGGDLNTVILMAIFDNQVGTHVPRMCYFQWA